MTEFPNPFKANGVLPWCILASSSEGICLVEATSGRIVWHNSVFVQACGGTKELVGASITKYFPNWPNIDCWCGDDGLYWQFRVSAHDEWLCIHAWRTAAPWSQTLIDSLTGLPDRICFDERIRTAWAEFQLSSGKPFALAFIDLDDFKKVNDAWGHLFGNEVLRLVADRLKSAFRTGDILARFGGDEFVALLFDFQQSECKSLVTQRIHDSMKEPIRIDDKKIAVSASVGVALSGEGYSNPEEMITAADRAMYASKPSRKMER